MATVVSHLIGYTETHGAASVIGPVEHAASEETAGGGAAMVSSLLGSFAPTLHWDALPWHLVGPALFAKAVIFSAVDFSATVAICATFEQVK